MFLYDTLPELIAVRSQSYLLLHLESSSRLRKKESIMSHYTSYAHEAFLAMTHEDGVQIICLQGPFTFTLQEQRSIIQHPEYDVLLPDNGLIPHPGSATYVLQQAKPSI